MATRAVDIRVENHGTLFRFVVLTEKGLTWVNERVSLEEYQWMGRDAFVVGHRYAEELVVGMRREGLTVE